MIDRPSSTRAAGSDDDPYPATEVGDAEFFAATVSGRALFDHAQGRWFLFHQHHWRPDATGQATQLAIESMRSRQELALTIADTEERTKRVKRALAGWRK